MIKTLKPIKFILSILISVSILGLFKTYKRNIITAFCLPVIAQEVGDIKDKVCNIQNPKIFHENQSPWNVNCIATKKCIWEEYVKKKFYICPEGYTQYIIDEGWNQKKIICKENKNQFNIIPPTVLTKFKWEYRDSYELIEVDKICGDLSQVKNKYKPIEGKQCPKVKVKLNALPNIRIKATYKCKS